LRRAERRKQRQIGAAARAETRASRSKEEQLALLDRKFGNGQGAACERARLNGVIDRAADELNDPRLSMTVDEVRVRKADEVEDAWGCHADMKADRSAYITQPHEAWLEYESH